MYPTPVRVLGLAALLAVTLAGAQAPRREGAYRPTDGKSVSWRIDDHHTLVWNGERYTPVGLCVEGDPSAVDAANGAGIKDLLIDLPLTTDWNASVAAADRNGQRYLLRLDSLSPGASGIAIDPASYRIAGITGSRHIDLALPGVSEALVVTALKRDGSVLNHKTVPVKDGRLVADTKVNANLENVVLIYPRTERLSLPDLWEGLDGHRDALLARLKRTTFGPGLRGVVDPLGRARSLPERELRGVPTSPAFQAELATVLESKHTNVEGVLAAWSLSASALSTYVGTGPQGRGTLKTTLSDLARLVPLWSGSRGVSYLWDPKQDQIFACDRSRSRIWEDIDEAVALAASRRMQRLCAAVRQIVDVPIVQEWSGWTGVTEDREPAFDGIAARAEGDAAIDLVDSAARAVSTATRWRTRGWLLATDVTVPSTLLDVSLSDLANLGLRAAFVRSTPMIVGPVAQARTSTPPPDFPIEPVFFPENAANPAAVQRLPGGRWWLPTPEDGNRLDLGRDFFGYRMGTGRGSRIVMWARTPGRYLMRMRQPDLVTVTSLDGSNPDPKKEKKGMSLTLTQSPLIIEGTDELPVPELAVKETLDEFGRLSRIAENGRRVGTDETLAFTQAASSFDANPGGSFIEMRDQLRRFASLLSPVAWIEAERTQDTTFSEVAPAPGASGGLALVLRSLLPPEEGYVANYSVPVRTADAVELWVAARLSPERRRELEATVGGQTLVASEPPVSAYGAGFAWYRLGTTRLSGGVAKVQFRMRSGIGAEAALDSIVFAPSGWRPNGVSYPYEVIGS